MPFLELVGITFIIVVFVGLSFAGFTVVLVAGGAFVVVNAVLGWLPIFIVGSDPDWLFRWVGGNFIERWAFVAILEYIGLTAVSVVLFFTRPDPDGLPPGWKFLSLFYISKPARHAYDAIHSGEGFDFEGFARDMKQSVGGRYREKVREKHLREAKQAMESQADRDRLEAELHQAAMDLEVARTERQAYEAAKAEEDRLKEFLKKHGK